MGGIFGVASKSNCVSDLFFGTDYHSHLGTRRGGMAVYGKEGGFNRAIHNIQNAPFRTKFERDVQELEGTPRECAYKSQGLSKNIFNGLVAYVFIISRKSKYTLSH